MSDGAVPGTAIAENEGGERLVPLAAVIGAHGVSGEVRLKLFGDSPDSLKAYGKLVASGRALTLKTIRPGPNGAVARFAEVADRNAAEALRGVELCVPRSALPPLGEGEYYHFDLIGLPCRDEAGEPLGHISAVQNFGAGDIIEISTLADKQVLVPMHAVVVGDGAVIVDPLYLD